MVHKKFGRSAVMRTFVPPQTLGITGRAMAVRVKPGDKEVLACAAYLAPRGTSNDYNKKVAENVLGWPRCRLSWQMSMMGLEWNEALQADWR
jgi:hypothetical protein